MTMYLEDFNKLMKNFVPGAKNISIKKGSYNGGPELIREEEGQPHGFFDLFFDPQSQLLLSNHYETKSRFKRVYMRDSDGRLSKVTRTQFGTNETSGVSEFSYDEDGRIVVEKSTINYHQTNIPEVFETHHQYEGYSEKIIRTSNIDDHKVLIDRIYDKAGNLIEEKAKRNFEDFLWWDILEYSADNILLQKTSLDENGEPTGISSYLPLLNGLRSGHQYDSVDTKYSFKKEYSYVFNALDHWVKRVTTKDGNPLFFAERTIEYYAP